MKMMMMAAAERKEVGEFLALGTFPSSEILNSKLIGRISESGGREGDETRITL